MNDTNKKDPSSLVKSTKKRLLIVILAIALIIVAAIGLGMYIHHENQQQAGASLGALPSVPSVPGAGDPSDKYVATQTQDNVDRASSALQKGGSALPTITRSSFMGNMQSFMQPHSGKKSNPYYVAPEQCHMPSAGPADCAVDKLKLARTGGVGAAELRCRGCQCPALKLAGYTAGDLKGAGWDAKTLHACGYSLSDLKAAGFSAADLRAAGFTADQLKAAGFSAAELKAAGFSAAELKKAGFSAADLAAAGFSAKDLKDAGFSAAELKKAGFSAADLASAGFSAKDLKAAGYDAADLLAAGFSPADLKKAGFSASDIAKGEAKLVAKGEQLKNCSVSALKKSRAAGVSAVALKKMGCGAAALRAAGYTAAELKAAGFSAKELKAAGFSAADLKAAGFSAADLKAAGFSAAQLRKAGFSAAALKAAGFSAKDLKDAGFSAKDLKAAGFSAKDLKAAGFSAGALKAAGYSAADLKKAGFSAADLRNAGFTAADLKSAGYSPDEMREAGYTDGDLLRAGYSPSQLGFGGKDSQCSVSALERAHSMGVPASALRKKGCSAYALRQAGYSAAELKAAGFTAGELRDAGFSAADLKKAGFTAAQLRAAGFTKEQLAKAGYTPGQLHAAGYLVNDLSKTGQCSSTMLAKARKLNIPVASLLKSGCTADELTTAGFDVPKTSSIVTSSGAVIPNFGGDPKMRRLAYLQAQQHAQMVADQRKADIQMEQSQMMSQASTMLADWGGAPTAASIKTLPNLDKSNGSSAGGAGSAMMPQSPTIKAGTVMFAVLDTGINTDEKSPILAEIVDGPLKGSKLLGQFQLAKDKVVLSFNIINIPGLQKTSSLNAVAIDENTAHTAVSGDANHHYWLRYGTLFASSFLSGVSEGMLSSSQTMGGGLLFPVLQQKQLSPTEEVMTGLGKAGQSYATEMGSNFHTPTTVIIPSGTGIGILFMQDFKLPSQGDGLLGGAVSGAGVTNATAPSNGKLSALAAAKSSLVQTGTQFAKTAANALGSAAGGSGSGQGATG